jgi:hypothetical protein
MKILYIMLSKSVVCICKVTFWFISYNYIVWVAARSRAWNIFGLLNTGIVDSNPIRGADVCVSPVFVLSCVGSGLATGWSPSQGVLPTVYKIQISELINSEWAQAKGPNLWRQKKQKKYTVTCMRVRVTKITGSSSGDWIYWHFSYNVS